MVFDKNEIFELLDYALGDDIEGIYKEEWGDCLYADKEKYNIIDDYGSYKGQEYEIHSGLTKIAIVSDCWDYVIKISIDGLFEECCIKVLNPDDDSIEEENRIYNSAFTEELKPILVPNYFVGHYRGMEIYVQQKIDFALSEINDDGELWEDYFGEEMVNSYSEIVDEVAEIIGVNPIRRLPSDFIYQLVQTYGKEQTANMIYRINDEGISDLHDGNVGFIDRKPVIFDYASYHDYEHWSYEEYNDGYEEDEDYSEEDSE